MNNQFQNLTLIATALGLELTRSYMDILNPSATTIYHLDDEGYIRDLDDLSEVAKALAKFVGEKEYTDVNRGIYLHKEKGATSYA
tara:strand:- start:210 stop:464 length:255 start_codon:yes stop_codon:yes gene_type:complete